MLLVIRLAVGALVLMEAINAVKMRVLLWSLALMLLSVSLVLLVVLDV